MSAIIPLKQNTSVSAITPWIQVVQNATLEQRERALHLCHTIAQASRLGLLNPTQSPTLQMAHAISLYSTTQRQPISLEAQFFEEATAIDLAKLPDFIYYGVPNELQPNFVTPHLVMTKPGLIVSTGAERSFFDLLFSDPKFCQGLVIRDIHPHIKAYVDFNVLLLRISETRQEYLKLSTLPSPDTLEIVQKLSEKEAEECYLKHREELLEKIRQRTENSDLPTAMKRYYRKHLEDFGRIYFDTMKNSWRSKSLRYNRPKETTFQGARYYEHDALFAKLQGYARAGNIIATVGDISELEFLNTRNIGVVDISNISDYAILHFKTQSRPTIVSTKVPDTYRSSKYQPLTTEQVQKLSQQIDFFVKMNFADWWNFRLGNAMSHLLEKGNPNISRSLEPRLCYYSQSLLEALEKHKKQYCLYYGEKVRMIASNGWIDFSPEGNLMHWITHETEKDLRLFHFVKDFGREQKLLISITQLLLLLGKIPYLPRKTAHILQNLPSWAQLGAVRVSGSIPS
jgi:hypothetical protein